MGTYRFEVDVGLGPVDALFLWADLDRVTGWMGVGGVSDVVVGRGMDPLVLPGRRFPLVIAPESGYTLRFRFRPVRVQVMWLDDRSKTAYRTRLAGSLRRGELLATFEQHGSGSHLTLDIQTEGLLPGVVGRLLATGSYPGTYRGQLKAFARLAERERLSRLIL